MLGELVLSLVCSGEGYFSGGILPRLRNEYKVFGINWMYWNRIGRVNRRTLFDTSEKSLRSGDTC